MQAGMNESIATTYCESVGYSNGLQSQMSTVGSNGMIMGFDINVF